MAKKVLTLIKLQIPAGAANPAPPVGPALGQHGVNIMDFCKAFNAQTQGGTDRRRRVGVASLDLQLDEGEDFLRHEGFGRVAVLAT